MRKTRMLLLVGGIMLVLISSSVAAAAEAKDARSGATSFEKLMGFGEGLAAVYAKGQWGFIDLAGKRVIEPLFHEVRGFRGDYAAARLEKRWGFIDRKGTFVINPQFDDARNFSEGLAVVKKENAWGVINEKGAIVLDYSYEDLKSFNGGLAPAKRTGKWGYIAKDGSFKIARTWLEAGEFADGFAPVKTVENQWGYIDTKGRYVIEAQFDGAGGFSGGLAPVQEETKWGFIDRKGKFRINPQYAGARPFKDDLAAVQSGGKWGYIDRKGRLAVPCSFDASGDFSGGRALVEKDGVSFYIDKKGGQILDVSARKVVAAAPVTPAAPAAKRSSLKDACGQTPCRITGLGNVAFGDIPVSNRLGSAADNDLVILNLSSSDLVVTANNIFAGMPNTIKKGHNYTFYNQKDTLQGYITFAFDDAANPDPFMIYGDHVSQDPFAFFVQDPCPQSSLSTRKGLKAPLGSSPAAPKDSGNSPYQWDGQMHWGRFATNVAPVGQCPEMCTDYRAYTVVSPRRTVTISSTNFKEKTGGTLFLIVADTNPGDGVSIFSQRISPVVPK